MIEGIIVVAIIGCVIFYLVRQRKKGVKCIGCPYAKKCGERHDKSGCDCCK